MTTPFTYEFGYSFWVVWGHLVPILLFGAIAAVGIRLGWQRWLVLLSSAVAVWGVVGLLMTHFVFRLNLPQPLASERFLASGSGRVIDIGAGSGRATVGLLLARPNVTVTAVDIYRGFFGIDDNTPERLMTNVRIAGADGRAQAIVGDARELPLPDAAFDGAISVAAIDHLPRAGIPAAVAEVARVLKPGGEFLLTVVTADAWAWIGSPHAMAHHRFLAATDWRALLTSSGFELLEQGNGPAHRYYLARRTGAPAGARSVD